MCESLLRVIDSDRIIYDVNRSAQLFRMKENIGEENSLRMCWAPGDQLGNVFRVFEIYFQSVWSPSNKLGNFSEQQFSSR